MRNVIAIWECRRDQDISLSVYGLSEYNRRRETLSECRRVRSLIEGDRAQFRGIYDLVHKNALILANTSGHDAY